MEKSNDIAKQTVKGILAFMSKTILLDILTVGTSLIVITVLTPAQVGIYTVIIAIQQVISFFTDFGFGAALVQKKDEITRQDVRTSFTLQASLTLTVFIIVALSRGLLMTSFKLDSDGFNLLLALVFAIFLSSFKVIPSILLERKINFQRLVIPQLVEAFVFNSILLILVITHHGLSSYTFAFLISSAVSIPFYYIVSPWEIGIGVHKESVKHLKFGLQFQIKNVLATIKDNLLIALLPRFLSFTQIGFIGVAQSLAFYPYKYVVDSITRVTFSTYARLQDNEKQLRGAIEKSLFFVSLFMFPILTGFILAMPYIIYYIPKWHMKWENVVVSLIFFSLNGIVSSLSGILVNTLDSNGKVKITLQLMVIWTILTWILTFALIHFFGYNGVAAASFLVTLTISYTIYLVKKHVIEFSFWKSIYKQIIGTVIMGLVFFFMERLFIHDIISVIFACVLCALVYFGTMYLLIGKEVIRDVRLVLKR